MEGIVKRIWLGRFKYSYTEVCSIHFPIYKKESDDYEM